MTIPRIAGSVGPTVEVGEMGGGAAGQIVHSDGSHVEWKDPQDVNQIAAIKATADAALPAAQKGAASGVAPLGSDSRLPADHAPPKSLYSAGGAEALSPGDIAAIPSSDRGASDGVAPLSGGRVPATNAPSKSTYATGGDQALAPSDIAAIPASEKAAANGVASLDSNGKVVQNPANASPTSAANTIPVGNGSGKLDKGWGGAAGSLATLDGSSLVEQSPKSASATPGANKIALANGSGKLDKDWGGSAGTLAQLDGSGQLPAGQAPAKSVYAAGGAQALAPSDIGALSTTGGTMTGGLKLESLFGIKPTVIATSNSPYPATGNDALFLAKPDTGDLTINLPSASGQTGRMFKVRNIFSSNNVILDADGSDTIEGAGTLSVPSGAAVEIVCDGTSKWFKI